MKEKITISISFPEEHVLDKAKERRNELGIRSFSEYVNQLIRYDLGLPNYISPHMKKRVTLDEVDEMEFDGIEVPTGKRSKPQLSANNADKVKNKWYFAHRRKAVEIR